MVLIVLRIVLLFAVLFFVARLFKVGRGLLRSAGKSDPKVRRSSGGKSPLNPRDIVEGRWKELED